MSRTLAYKLALIVAVTALSAFLMYPPQEKIKLGLDLQGGLHLVLEVVTEEAVVAEVRDTADNFEQLLEDEGVSVDSVEVEAGAGFTVRLASADAVGRARELAREYYPTYDDSVAGGGQPGVRLDLTGQQRDEIEDRAVRQALQTVRNRIDAYGVTEPVIQRQGLGGNRLLVQLPGVEDADRVRDLLQRTAQLKLHIVESGPAASRDQLLEPHGGELPEDTAIFPTAEDAEPGGAGPERYYLVGEEPVVTGNDLKTARLGQDQMGMPAVSFTLNAQGAPKMGRVTEENMGRQLAIVLDERIFSAPVIEGRISTDGIIRGDFTIQEAEDLALVLRSGALPASMEELEQRFVGPSLGRESINQGVVAAVVGMILVVIFMLLYYRGAGINAIVALALNLVIVLGVMGYLGATLTLPGIAGLILLIGMAVDANVIIFERIREEIDIGKTVRASIDAGFDKAFSAIFDANLTTLIAAVFLFQFGTGPVKGFAVTITIGIAASMFTALFVSRVLFTLWTRNRASSLSI